MIFEAGLNGSEAVLGVSLSGFVLIWILMGFYKLGIVQF